MRFDLASDVRKCSWPMEYLGDALLALTRYIEINSPNAIIENPGCDLLDEKKGIDRWLTEASKAVGLEAEGVYIKYKSIEKDLQAISPALVELRDGDQKRFLVLVKFSNHTFYTLTQDLKICRIAQTKLSKILCKPIESRHSENWDQLLNQSNIPDGQREKIRSGLLQQLYGNCPIPNIWILRTSPETDWWELFKRAHIPRRITGLLASHVIYYIMWLVSWGILGSAVLQGRIDKGWFIAWILLLITMIPFKSWVTWLQGTIAIEAGGLLKQQLLHGTLKMPLDNTRHQGIGHLYSKVIEGQELEALTLNSGINSIIACLELMMAIIVLMLGSGGLVHVLLLAALLFGAYYLVLNAYKKTKKWVNSRFEMTQHLVEGMIGYQTRLAQQNTGHLYERDDENTEEYLSASTTMDNSYLPIMVLPRVWLFLGILGLGPVIILGTENIAGLAISLGGILLCYRALMSLSAGITNILHAYIAWQNLSPFLKSNQPETKYNVQDINVSRRHKSRNGEKLIEAHDIAYSYQGKNIPVFQECNFRINVGDHILLEGKSGSGKSTLANLITGLRVPDTGLLLMHGLDRNSLGYGIWRQSAVSSPQFHDNYIFMETFAFNVLMGRGWPPTQEDLIEAETVCRELELGDLLDRMPGGMMQMVGDTGWKLSHGEKSRVYIARALMMDADLYIFDESFAALDPESLQKTLRYAINKSKTSIVIAHP